MIWRCLNHYGMEEATAMLDEFVASVQAFDPATASRTQVAVATAELSKLNGCLNDVELELRREEGESSELTQSYEDHLQAALDLEARLANVNHSSQSERSSASLITIRNLIEQIRPEIEHEQREDWQADAWISELRRAADELTQKIRSAHAALRPTPQMGVKTSVQRELTPELRSHTKKALRLINATRSLSIALDAMDRAASNVRANMNRPKSRSRNRDVDDINGDPAPVVTHDVKAVNQS